MVAAGLTLAFGTAGVLNLAHGTLYAVGAYTAATLSDGTWTGMLLGVAAGTAAATGSGLLLAVGTAPLVRRGHLAQALLTFGVALVGGNLLVEFFGADEIPVHLPAALDHSVRLLGHRYPTYRLLFIGVAAVLAAAGHLVLKRTRAGAAVRAAADDPGMLAATGTSPRLVHTAMLGAAGALAGLAGSLGAPVLGPGPSTADTVLLLSLVVVVLGNLSSMGRVLLAAIAVGEIQTLGVALIPDWAPYLLFAAMAAALVLRAQHGPLPSGAAAPPAVAQGSASRAARRVAALAVPFAEQFPAAPRRWGRHGWPLPVLALLAAAPALTDAYTVGLVGYALAIGLLAVSVMVHTGVAGLPTLGQAAPFAVGAYSTALLAQAGWTSGFVQLAAAAAGAALFATLTGLAVVRARGTTVLMITLAIGELTSTAVGRWTSLTGGTDGIAAFPAPHLLGLSLDTDSAVYWYALAVATLAVVSTWLVLRSPAGMLLAGCRDAEPRMHACGHPVTRYLMFAHLGSAALAGLGGSLLATVHNYVSPEDVSFEVSAMVLLAVVLGGTRSILGALLGAGLIVATRDWLSGPWPGHGPLLLGSLFILAVYLLPRGLAGLKPATHRPSEVS